MRIRNPIYLPFALFLAGYVALANHNGWSPLQSLALQTWHRGYPSTMHK